MYIESLSILFSVSLEMNIYILCLDCVAIGVSSIFCHQNHFNQGIELYFKQVDSVVGS